MSSNEKRVETVVENVDGMPPTPTTSGSKPLAAGHPAVERRPVFTRRAGPAVAPATTATAPPVAALLAQLQGVDVDELEAAVVGVREAVQRGDHSAVGDALLNQALLLDTVGARLLTLAGAPGISMKALETYTGLAMRALEQARKSWATLASLRDGGKSRVTTAVQVNVGQSGTVSTNEILPSHATE